MQHHLRSDRCRQLTTLRGGTKSELLDLTDPRYWGGFSSLKMYIFPIVVSHMVALLTELSLAYAFLNKQ